MRRASILIAALVFGATPARAAADPPARITVVAVFSPITFGDNGYVNGQLLGNAQAGQTVVLEQSTPPTYADWTPVAQATADWAGYYSFKVHPTETMQYRTSSQGYGSERAVQVSVAPRLRLKAQAADRSSIRFSGTIAPAFAGSSVQIQRQTKSGRWTRVTTARLHGGKTFAGRIRARRPLVLRAFYPALNPYFAGVSNVARASPTP